MPQTIQIQADWAQTDSTQIDFIKNKPVFYEEWWGTQADYDAILVKDPDKIYNIIYEEPQINYFYVEDISGSDNTLSIKKGFSDSPTIEVFKSTDGTNWTSMGQTDTTPITATVPANSKLYLKATTNNWGGSKWSRLGCNAAFNIGGCVMSLLAGDNFENAQIGTDGLRGLFGANTYLTNAQDLILPNNVASNCFRGIFDNCTGLITAPVLPATTLANYCYRSMFQGCASLTTAPTLPATTLAIGCYREMFQNCSLVNSIITFAENVSLPDCTQGWLYNVAATGDFYNLGGATYTSGENGIPTGWTEHTSL